jgi:TRAP transporter TAXI family solute receptor
MLILAGAQCGCERARRERPPDTIRVVSNGPAVGELLARYQNALKGIRLSLVGDSGSVAAVAALQQGKADIGFAQADVVYAAYRKALPDHAEPHGTLRGIAVGRTVRLYVVVRRDSPFRQISDLKTRRIGLAPVGTHARVYERMIVEAYGLDKTAELKSYTDEEMASHLVDGTLDAAIFGQASIPERMNYVSRAVGIRVLDIGGDAIAKLRARYPFFTRVMVTSKDLPGEPGEVQTLGVDNLLVCRADLADDRVYELTRGFFEASNAIDPDRAAATPIPLHPGAGRYYREREVLQ